MITYPEHTFTLSIEPVEGETFVYPFHLGTIEDTAITSAENIFRTY